VNAAAAVRLFPAHIERITVEVAPCAEPPVDEDIQRVWSRMQRENPRLFGGGIYNVLSLDPGRGRILAAYDLYKRLVVQPEIDTGVNQLSVSGLIIAPGDDGRRRILIGKRGEQTRMYGGMWQICPAGGVEPPEDTGSLRTLTHEDLTAQLERELEEEVGMRLGGAGAPRPIAIIHDAAARSYDIVLRVDFDHPCPPRPQKGAGWEHAEIRWVPLEEIPEFCSRRQVIAATRALFGSLGWLTPHNPP
jgi:8-oxo-dGTP pyrophosphatase MutT (NUDIX family)